MQTRPLRAGVPWSVKHANSHSEWVEYKIFHLTRNYLEKLAEGLDRWYRTKGVCKSYVISQQWETTHCIPPHFLNIPYGGSSCSSRGLRGYFSLVGIRKNGGTIT